MGTEEIWTNEHVTQLGLGLSAVPQLTWTAWFLSVFYHVLKLTSFLNILAEDYADMF